MALCEIAHATFSTFRTGRSDLGRKWPSPPRRKAVHRPHRQQPDAIKFRYGLIVLKKAENGVWRKSGNPRCEAVSADHAVAFWLGRPHIPSPPLLASPRVHFREARLRR